MVKTACRRRESRPILRGTLATRRRVGEIPAGSTGMPANLFKSACGASQSDLRRGCTASRCLWREYLSTEEKKGSAAERWRRYVAENIRQCALSAAALGGKLGGGSIQPRLIGAGLNGSDFKASRVRGRDALYSSRLSGVSTMMVSNSSAPTKSSTGAARAAAASARARASSMTFWSRSAAMRWIS